MALPWFPVCRQRRGQPPVTQSVVGAMARVEGLLASQTPSCHTVVIALSVPWVSLGLSRQLMRRSSTMAENMWELGRGTEDLLCLRIWLRAYHRRPMKSQVRTLARSMHAPADWIFYAK